MSTLSGGDAYQDGPSLHGKAALVTGGSRGLGKAIAQCLASAGAAVAVNYHASPAAAEEVVAEIEAFGGKAIALAGNVADPADCERLVAESIAGLGRLDIVVNNAGITKDALIYEMAATDWLDVMRVNLGGVINCTKAAMGHFMLQRGGSIINISSVMGLRGWTGQSPYAASKGAINSFTQCSAVELARFGVRVNAVLPGFAETELVAGLTSRGGGKGILRQIPMRSFARPEDVARVVAFLASDSSAYMTGSLITVDGGASTVLGVGASL
jgi:3-oxoacyl-[acyl-carrier protein] reductase